MIFKSFTEWSPPAGQLKREKLRGEVLKQA